MPSILVIALFVCGCVLLTALLAAGGSGWKAFWPAIRGFGGWMAGVLLLGVIVWACMPTP